MTILEFSQIIFNLVISVAVIVVTVLFGVIAYDIIQFSKVAKKFFNDVSKESSELYEKINKFLESIFSLSFISKIFNKKNNKINKK